MNVDARTQLYHLFDAQCSHYAHLYHYHVHLHDIFDTNVNVSDGWLTALWTRTGLQVLDMYTQVYEGLLAVPVIQGNKTCSEKVHLIHTLPTLKLSS